ncbi:MAG: leucine-rich repeat domain-containing protein [Ruminococcaceae bacterium]|nr:leucine-rich repeat domain-containing protein [Oscillospiraceae bacterium]
MVKINFNIQEIFDVVKDEHLRKVQYIIRDGFVFSSLTKENVFDALVVRESIDTSSFCEAYSVGSRTMEECIELINYFNLESAVFIINDISILKRCPTVKHFTLYLDSNATTVPKYGTLSLLPGIRPFSNVGKYGIEELYTGGESPLVFQKLKTLKQLHMSAVDEKEFSRKTSIVTIEDFDLPELIKLTIVECGITSLKGIQKCPKLQWLDLCYMRKLSDISDISALAPTLRMLAFENCPKITDFSVISKLKELEYLELKGKNELPNLDFIKDLPKLKFMILTMNVLDGNVSCLKNIQYVDAVCKRHYNLKNKDLPKDRTDLGFEFI